MARWRWSRMGWRSLYRIVFQLSLATTGSSTPPGPDRPRPPPTHAGSESPSTNANMARMAKMARSLRWCLRKTANGMTSLVVRVKLRESRRVDGRGTVAGNRDVQSGTGMTRGSRVLVPAEWCGLSSRSDAAGAGDRAGFGFVSRELVTAGVRVRFAEPGRGSGRLLRRF